MPIPGTKRLRYLEENVAAASITLTADEQQQLEAVTERLPVTGERYTPEGMKGLTPERLWLIENALLDNLFNRPLSIQQGELFVGNTGLQCVVERMGDIGAGDLIVACLVD